MYGEICLCLICWKQKVLVIGVNSAIERHSKGIYGKLVPAVLWTDARGDDGELIVPADPTELVAKINRNPFILLHNHDPGRPKGQTIESANFVHENGSKFVVAILGFYAGGDVLEFNQLGIDTRKFEPSPEELPEIPDNARIEFATDPREVDSKWLEQVTNSAPIQIKYVELSHNTAEVTQELIRIGIGFLAIVWNPFTTSIASEAGKRTYIALHGWVRKLLTKLADRKNPLLDISSYQDGCQVSFLFRGKNVKLLYAAHDALPEAAAQAKQLIGTLRARGNPPRQLTYEWDQESLRWYPTYTVLDDKRIIVDSGTLIALEKLPSGLSLGIRKGKTTTPVLKSAPKEEEK